MAVIQANRESIDDRFSVLGFTIRTENPLFEIGLATDPELLKAENRQRRTSSNFFSSKLLAAAQSRRGEAVYLVPPNVVARFVGQPRLYFGVATYDQRDRNHPSSVSIPDRGNMYVSLSGLTERGLRRTARLQEGGGYGGNGNGNALAWGGDALTSTATRRQGNGNGNGKGAAASAPDDQPAYSDGYSDDLWRQSGATTTTAPGGANGNAATDATVSHGGNGAATEATPATAQSYHGAAARTAPAHTGPAHTGAVQRRTPLGIRRAPLVEPLLVSSYYQPTGWVDALRTQLGFFVSSAMWFLGVSDTRSPPHSAICQVRRPDGSAEGALHGSAFFIAPNLLLTAAHVVDGQTELIIVPGKNGGGAGTTTEPFGRFRVAAASMRKHPSYNASSAASSDFDMALIRVPAANAARADQYFDLVEELLESRPEGVVVCGYAARWYANDLIEHFVNENIDPNRQHLHGGHIRSLPTEETFDYDLQTLGGTSGSPVYWIQEGSSPRAHMVGVHVAAHSETTNLGCRITAGKLSWIRGTAADWGQTMTFSLGTIAHEQPTAGEGEVTGRGAGRAYAVAQEIITPFYDPADSATALTSQADAFSPAREEWFAGVPNTTIFPHSAICLLEMRDASGGLARGTGFYIGRNRILTCAHNLHGMASVDIVPGKNGQGGTSEPFGRATVTSASWRIPASYGGSNSAYDLAVIDNAPIAAPGDRWFDVLEELNQSRPEGVVVCGYSSRSKRVPELTSAIDGFKQHLHAGYIAALGAGDSTFDYPILTLARASGSPVYYISDKDGSRKAYIVGVHISSASADMNRGCRLSQAKIDWIQGRATSLALGVPSRALVIGPEDVQRAQRHAPHWADLFNWTPPDWLNGALAARSMRVQRIQDAIGELNLDRYEVRCTSLPSGWSDTALLDHLRTNLNDFLDTDNSEFIPYAVGTDDVKWGSSSPVGAVFKIDIVGPDNAAVVGSLVEDRRFRFTTIHTSWSGDHPVSGHREFGVRTDGDAVVFYTRGADRATNGMFETAVFAGAHHLWLSFQRKLSAWINANGGSATVPAPFSERFHPEVVRILFGSTSQALASRPLEIPLDPGIGGQSIGLDALSPGDIIVSTARHPVSYAIRAGTLSAISHAMLYVGDGNIIEAVGDGVREVPLGTAIGDAILAVSYRDPRVDPAKAAAVVAFARSQLGRPYNYGGAARAGYRIIHPLASRVLDAIRDVSGVDDTSARTFYCSELVFAAFEAAGIPLVAAPAGDSTPNDVVQLTRGSLGYVGHLKARDELLGVALSADAEAPATTAAPLPEYPVTLIPQPNKEASWASAMAMLLSWRRKPAVAPHAVIEELGTTLVTSYNEELLAAAQERYGFRMISPLADTAAYHSPQQWAQWLGTHGPLWVLIVGAPHAVVIAGIRGELTNAASVKVKMLNPWDTRVAFDGDPVEFHPANQGYEDWISFEQFAADFGNMAKPDYSDWRLLHLPVAAANAHSPGTARNGASQDVQHNVQHNAPVSSSQGLAAVAAGEVVKHIVKEVLTSAVPGQITIRADKFSGWYFPGGTPVNVDRSERHTLYLSDRPVMFDPPMGLPVMDSTMRPRSFELLPRTRDYETVETHTSDGGVLGPDFTSDELAQFRTFQNFKVKWASDGTSVGLIYIEAEDGAAADETKLDVTAEIQMHPSLEPSGRPTYARVDVVFKQVFTDRRGDTHRGESVVSLRGDGTSVGRFNWTAR